MHGLQIPAEIMHRTENAESHYVEPSLQDDRKRLPGRTRLPLDRLTADDIRDIPQGQESKAIEHTSRILNSC